MSGGNEPQPRSEEEALEAVKARAAVDPEFRQLLLEDPRQAVLDEVGVELPEDLTVKFVEKDAGVDLMAVLPDPIPEAEELTEDELEAVAGGAEGCWWTCVCSETEVETESEVQ
jgi:hypothetical protein